MFLMRIKVFSISLVVPYSLLIIIINTRENLSTFREPTPPRLALRPAASSPTITLDPSKELYYKWSPYIVVENGNHENKK